MLDRLRQLFREDRDIHVDEALERFEEEHSDTFDRIDERASRFRSEIEQMLDEIDDELERLVAYSDPDNRAIIDDVTSNIGADRQDLLNGLETDAPLDRLREDLDEMLEEFEMMSQKEKQVLDEIGSDVKQAFTTVRDLKERHADLAEFVDSTYIKRDAREELESLIMERERFYERIQELGEKIASVDLEDIDDQIDEVRDELEQHRSKDKWEKLEQIEDEIEAKQDEIQEQRSRIQRSLGKMERGLKKLVYRAENGDLEFDEEIVATLKELQEKEVGATDPVEDAVEAAGEAIRSYDIVDAEERFMDGATALEDLGSIRSNIQSIEAEMEELYEELDAFELEEQEEELEDRIASLEEERDDLLANKERLEERKEEFYKKIDETEEEIESLLQEHLSGDITLMTDES